MEYSTADDVRPNRQLTPEALQNLRSRNLSRILGQEEAPRLHTSAYNMDAIRTALTTAGNILWEEVRKLWSGVIAMGHEGVELPPEHRFKPFVTQPATFDLDEIVTLNHHYGGLVAEPLRMLLENLLVCYEEAERPPHYRGGEWSTIAVTPPQVEIVKSPTSVEYMFRIVALQRPLSWEEMWDVSKSNVT